ncbi:Dirigent protein 21 [Ananas comosus]|uniref:Dirigent protein n=1 Tax=Ananas comosus TaxID=4615 RepID=A0A199ULM9_ANACO|nr:Dirigent protein 21 [Ananas comosus]
MKAKWLFLHPNILPSPPPPPPLPSYLSTITAANAELTTRFSERPHKKKLKEKLSHLHFYFHDIVRGKNITAVPVTAPSRSAGSPASAFGVITIMDDALTMGPEPTSAPVGRAQGCTRARRSRIWIPAGHEPGVHGGHVRRQRPHRARSQCPLHAVREIAVVGGSGLFRFARGYAVARPTTSTRPRGMPSWSTMFTSCTTEI